MALFRAGVEGAALLDFLLPPACAGCGAHLPAAARAGGRRSCPACRSRLKAVPHPRCPRCGAPRAAGGSAGGNCPECREWPDFLLTARTAVVLAPPADTLVHQFKYGGWPELAGELAERIVHTLRSEGEGWGGRPVVPVPTTPRRLRQRGYNQAGLLAAEVATRLSVPLVPALRRREGESQVSLDRGARLENVRRAFSIEAGEVATLRGKEVILVDDVLTTGATATAAAETLCNAGVAGVHLLAFARSIAEMR